MHSPSAQPPIPLLPINDDDDDAQAHSSSVHLHAHDESSAGLLASGHDSSTSAKQNNRWSNADDAAAAGHAARARIVYPPTVTGGARRIRSAAAARRARTVAGFGKRERGSIRHALYLLLERPTSSNSAFVLHAVTNVVIVLSALLTILETLPFFHTVNTALWFGLETAVVVLFTVEYIARSIAWGFGERDGWRRWWNWATSFFALIDLFSILPYYIELALHADTTAFFRFSILRTFRLLRVFRPFRYSSTILLTIEVMILSTKRSKHALLALSFFVSMALVVFSTLLYFAERGTWDDALETFVDAEGMRSQFESIPAAAWFVLVTITTVGYGEIIPRSFLGRLITVPLLLFGLLLVALPSFVLGREFAVVWEEMSAGVLDGLNLGLGDTPESPITPYTGREAAMYDVLPGDEDEETAEPTHTRRTGGHAHTDSRVTNDDDDGVTSPLTGSSKNKPQSKGKGRVLFDSGADEEERGVGIGVGVGNMTRRIVSASSSLPSLAGAKSAAAARERDRERREKRERVDSNAEAHTSAFMGLHHRRNVSAVNVGGAVGAVGGGEAVEVRELRDLVRELRAEREALRLEREALKLEREMLAAERAARQPGFGSL